MEVDIAKSSDAGLALPVLGTSAAKTFEELQNSADVKWKEGDTVVFYIGADRYQYVANSEENACVCGVLEERRDWRKELFDLYIRVESARCELLIESPKEFLQSQIDGLDLSRADDRKRKILLGKQLEKFEASIETSVIERSCCVNEFYRQTSAELQAEYPGLEQSPFFIQRADQISRIGYVIQAIQEYMEQSKALHDKIYEERVAFVEGVTERSALISPETINCYFDDGGLGGGVAGRHKMLAHSIRILLPGSKVRVYGITSSPTADFFRVTQADSGVEIVSIARQRVVEAARGAHVHLYEEIDGSSFDAARRQSDLVLPISSMPGLPIRSQEGHLAHETSSHYYSSQHLPMYLQDPYGTYPLDIKLAQAAAAAQAMPLSELEDCRLRWVDKIGTEYSRSLVEISEHGGWNVAKSIWSWAYFADPDRFLQEMQMLSQALVHNKFEDQDVFLDGGRQVVIFAARSKRLDRPVGPTEWSDLGFTVISEKGEVVRPGPSKPCLPATIVWMSGLDNDLVRELLTELVGACTADDQGLRLKFPVYCTGNASFAEAVSAGQITAHDRVDGAAGFAEATMKYLWQRASAAIQIPHAERDTFIQKESASMLMGDPSHIERYTNLREWTRISNAFHSAIMKYNTAYDIVDRVHRFQVMQIASSE